MSSEEIDTESQPPVSTSSRLGGIFRSIVLSILVTGVIPAGLLISDAYQTNTWNSRAQERFSYRIQQLKSPGDLAKYLEMADEQAEDIKVIDSITQFSLMVTSDTGQTGELTCRIMPTTSSDPESELIATSWLTLDHEPIMVNEDAKNTLRKQCIQKDQKLARVVPEEAIAYRQAGLRISGAGWLDWRIESKHAARF